MSPIEQLRKPNLFAIFYQKQAIEYKTNYKSSAGDERFRLQQHSLIENRLHEIHNILINKYIKLFKNVYIWCLSS